MMGGFTPDQYVLFDLENNNPKNYISRHEEIKMRAVNSPFKQIVNNRIVSIEAFSHYVKVQRLFGRIDNEGRLISNCRELRHLSDLDSLLEQQGTLLFRKTWGRQHRKISKQDGVYSFEDGRIFSDWEWLKRLRNWRIFEHVTPHAYLGDLQNRIPPTIKIIVFRDPKSTEWKIAFAVHRTSSSAGRLTSKVDLETGTLSNPIRLSTSDEFFVHPDTLVPFEGLEIPHWQKIKDDIIAASSNFHFLYYLVYTIVVTEDGFTVVNTKASTELTSTQIWGGQANQELGDFFRAHGLLKKGS